MPLASTTVGGALTAVAAVGLVALHTLVAAVATRYFRLQLSTRWGPVLYTLALVPVLYVPTVLVAFGALGLGAGLELDRRALLVLFWGVPLSLGVSVDLFWMPGPDDG